MHLLLLSCADGETEAQRGTGKPDSRVLNMAVISVCGDKASGKGGWGLGEVTEANLCLGNKGTRGDETLALLIFAVCSGETHTVSGILGCFENLPFCHLLCSVGRLMGRGADGALILSVSDLVERRVIILTSLLVCPGR